MRIDIQLIQKRLEAQEKQIQILKEGLDEVITFAAINLVENEEDSRNLLKVRNEIHHKLMEVE